MPAVITPLPPLPAIAIDTDALAAAARGGAFATVAVSAGRGMSAEIVTLLSLNSDARSKRAAGHGISDVDQVPRIPVDRQSTILVFWYLNTIIATTSAAGRCCTAAP
jgi:hypothetical protein